MRSAYYYNKLPMYIQQLAKGERILISFKKVRKIIHEILEKYNTNIVICHNAYFDYTSLNITTRFLNKGKYFFNYDIQVWDTLKMFYDTIYRQKSYIKFCIENGYMTKHKTPRPQAKAETIYRYLTDNTDFIENHTGLEDTLIEKDIFVNCLKQHKKMRKKLFEN
jgi:cell division protein YceG involved in septum cleavage